MSAPTSPFKSVREIAVLFSVSPKTVYHWVASDSKFPALKAGRHLRFDADKVVQYFEVKTEEAKPACFKNEYLLHLLDSKKRSLKNRHVRSAGSSKKED